MSSSHSSRPIWPDDGELPCLHGADQLAAPQRRPLRIQRKPNWRAPHRSVRGRAGRDYSPGLLRMATIPAGGRYGAEAAALHAQLTWWTGGFYDGSLDQFLWTGAWNPTPLLTLEFSGEWNRGTLEGGAFTQTLVGKPRARQPVVGPVSGELPAVRHRQPSARDKHAPALDIPAGWRALRRLQPQRQTTARPMGAEAVGQRNETAAC